MTIAYLEDNETVVLTDSDGFETWWLMKDNGVDGVLVIHDNDTGIHSHIPLDQTKLIRDKLNKIIEEFDK